MPSGLRFDLVLTGSSGMACWKIRRCWHWGRKEERRADSCVRALKAAVDVVLVKTRRNTCAKLLGLDQAGDVLRCLRWRLQGWTTSNPRPTGGSQDGPGGGCRGQPCQGSLLGTVGGRFCRSRELWPSLCMNAKGRTPPVSRSDQLEQDPSFTRASI